MLLLLDNCEHLLPALALLVAGMLTAAPRLVVLATSRVALRLSYERRYPLAPLSLECDDQRKEAHAPAVDLFVERAQAVRSSVMLDYEAIDAICRRLDGLPLAIELAATRVRLLNPHALLERLEQRLPLLGATMHDLPERHQTLYATIDWSYQLLDAGQRAIARRLSVFAGGWTLAAAEGLCCDLSASLLGASTVLDGMVALLDASLISEIPSTRGELRCGMLETIREYLYAQLEAEGELEHTQELHAGLVRAWASQAEVGLSSSSQREWLQRVEADLDNVRAVLTWCCTTNIGMGLRIASDLQRFWIVRGLRREGREWLERLLEHADTTHPLPTNAERGYGLLVAGMLAMFLNDFEQATKRLIESLAIYHQLEDLQNIAWALNNLGNVGLQQADYPTAEKYYQQSLALRRQINHTLGMASTLNNLAEVARLQGDFVLSLDYFKQSLAFYRQAGDQAAAASVMGHMATVLFHQGDYAQSRELYQASYEIARDLQSKPGMRQTLNGLGNVAYQQGLYGAAKDYYRQSLVYSVEIHHVGAVLIVLFSLGAIAVAEENFAHAAMLLGAADALNRNAKLTPEPEELAKFEQALATVRSVLDRSTFTLAWNHGQSLSLEQLVEGHADELL